MEPRPFTVIGGFLGAGKTTLVNRLLGAAGGVRYAVLVNDFGAVNVDAALIEEHDGRTMALTNGCICCSLADGFITTMLRLMAEPESFDHVIVEASGVALPDRIMDFARLDPLLAPDAIVVLADAETLAERLIDRHVGEVVAAQIAEADIVLVSKLDLVGASAFAAIETEIHARNPKAAIFPVDPRALPATAVLGTGMGQESARKEGHLHASFQTITLRAETPLAFDAFSKFADALPASVLRGKGRVSLNDGRGILWQRVGKRVEVSTLQKAPDASEVVLIGLGSLLGKARIPPEMAILAENEEIDHFETRIEAI